MGDWIIKTIHDTVTATVYINKKNKMAIPVTLTLLFIFLISITVPAIFSDTGLMVIPLGSEVSVGNPETLQSTDQYSILQFENIEIGQPEPSEAIFAAPASSLPAMTNTSIPALTPSSDWEWSWLPGIANRSVFVPDPSTIPLDGNTDDGINPFTDAMNQVSLIVEEWAIVELPPVYVCMDCVGITQFQGSERYNATDNQRLGHIYLTDSMGSRDDIDIRYDDWVKHFVYNLLHEYTHYYLWCTGQQGLLDYMCATEGGWAVEYMIEVFGNTEYNTSLCTEKIGTCYERNRAGSCGTW